MDSTVRYFEKPGEQNTAETVELAVARAAERNIKHIVVASDTGNTGVLVAEKASKKGIGTVVVTEAYGSSEKGKWDMDERNVEKLKGMGVPVVAATHALSGVERSITKKLGGASRVEAIAEALRSLFGQGMKVCVEISAMAADSGTIPCGDETEVVAIAGTASGVDTAVVVRPSHAGSFFDLQVREIIAIPRKR